MSSKSAWVTFDSVLPCPSANKRVKGKEGRRGGASWSLLYPAGGGESGLSPLRVIGVANPEDRGPGFKSGPMRVPKGVALSGMGVTLREWEGPGRCGSLG